MNDKKQLMENGLEKFPNSLYKYYTYSEDYNEKRLNGELFFSNPERFNDVFDTRHEVFNNSINMQKNRVIDRLKEIKYKNPEEIYNRLISDDLNTVLEVRRKQIENVGIFCLTNSPLNILMWAYYGNNEGYCIEYNISKLRACIEKELEKRNLSSKRYIGKCVFYSHTLPASPLFFDDAISDSVFDKYFYKAKMWEHENEYRIVISLGADMIIPIDGIVKSITLGYNMNVDNKFSLISKLLGSKVEIYFLQKLRGTDCFERVRFQMYESEKKNIVKLKNRIEEYSNL